MATQSEVMVLDGDSPRARAADSVTSHKAADSSDVHGSKAEVLRLLRKFGPMCDDVLLAYHEIDPGEKTYTPQRLRTARKTLVNDGLVRNSGVQMLTRSMRWADVFEAVS